MKRSTPPSRVRRALVANLAAGDGGSTAGDENVVDADFEEVKDDKKKSA